MAHRSDAAGLKVERERCVEAGVRCRHTGAAVEVALVDGILVYRCGPCKVESTGTFVHWGQHEPSREPVEVEGEWEPGRLWRLGPK